MEYPDGTTVIVGDHIWWNEGASVGFVQTIIEGKDEEVAWGLDGPHILISGYHPKNPSDAGYVAYPPSDFADEGIAPLTNEEEELLASAITDASAQSGYREPFLIGVVCSDCQIQAITFSTFDGEKSEEFGRVMIRIRGTTHDHTHVLPTPP
jgi:hypothetical protein